MKFTRQFNFKAWNLYNSMLVQDMSKTERKALKSFCFKKSYLILSTAKKGVVTFWKLKTKEVTQRRVISVGQYFKLYHPEKLVSNFRDDTKTKHLFKFVDLDKLESGEVNCFISFNEFQYIN